MANLWDYDEPIETYAARPECEGIAFPEVPRWIDSDIMPCDVAAIVQGGCDSGAYMPAVTYHQALETMREHGDEIFDYLDEGIDMTIPSHVTSWAGLACWFVSRAVEQWAASVEDWLSNALDEMEEAAEGEDEDEGDEEEGATEEAAP